MKLGGKYQVNKLDNEVAFARQYLVNAGYIDNSVWGKWILTEAGKTVDMNDELIYEIYRNRGVQSQAKITNGESALGDADINAPHSWVFAPGEGAGMWEDFYTKGIMALGWSEAGDLTRFKTKDEIKDALQANLNPDAPFLHPKLMLWQFVHDMKPGDIVFAKKGRSEIIGRGVVESDYMYD